MTSHSTRFERRSAARQQISAALADCLSNPPAAPQTASRPTAASPAR